MRPRRPTLLIALAVSIAGGLGLWFHTHPTSQALTEFASVGTAQIPPSAPDARRRWLLRRYGQPKDANALLEARRQLQEMAERESQKKKDGGISDWEWLGPGNAGGRVRTILTDPNDGQHLLTAGVSGGVWDSPNWGASWSPNTNLLANLAVTSLVRDTLNPNFVYAGTGEIIASQSTVGAGIFRSVDGGATWLQLPNANPAIVGGDFFWVNRLAHYPDQAGHLLAACEGGLYEGTAFGNSWSLILDVNSIMDIDFDPFNSDRIMLGARNGAYLSEDGGATWITVTDGLHGPIGPTVGRCEIAFARSAPNRVYMNVDQNGGELWRSLNGGVSWALIRNGDNWFENAPGRSQGAYDNAIWVSPVDANLVVVGGIDLWRTLDGGASFIQISDWAAYHTGQSAHADQHVIVEDAGYNGSTNRVVFVGNDGGVQMANDIRTVSKYSGWTNLANNLGITQFYGGAAAPDGSVIVGGTQDNFIQRYRPADGTDGWFQATTGDGGFCAVNPLNPDILYGEYQFMQILKSVDGGDSFALATSGLTEAGDQNLAPFVAPLAMDPNDPETLVAVGTFVWRTTDGAGSWQAIRGAPFLGGAQGSAVDIAQGNSDLIWVGYEGGELVRRNADGSWFLADQQGPAGMLPDATVTDIAINPFDNDEVFVTLGSFGPSRVWYTDDAGVTWQSRSGNGTTGFLPSIPVRTITFNPQSANWIYIGTGLGVLASEDKGVSWSVMPAFGSNEGPLNVPVNDLFWYGDYLVAATHGRGMYRTRPVAGLVVTNDDDSGLGSLRSAIEVANADPDVSTISFAILGTGPHIIQTVTRLPTITSPVIIDGRSQMGWTGNSLVDQPGFTGFIPILIDAGGRDGLRVFANDCEILGLDIYNANRGIWLDQNTGVVLGCRIGNSNVGIRVDGRGNRVGDVDALSRNSIENCNAGIRVTSGDINLLVGNRIVGSTPLGIDHSPNNVVNPNDPDDLDSGPNHGVNFPDLTSATIEVDGLRIQGSIMAPEGKTYSVHFYSSTACDPLGHGGADAYLGTADYTRGRFRAAIIINTLLEVSVAEGSIITATATVSDEGTSEFSNCVAAVLDPTAVEPISFRTGLDHAVPNPFNPRTKIYFQLAQSEMVRLDVFDVRGRRVRTLVDGERIEAGRHSLLWLGVDDSGAKVASGSYRVRLLTSQGMDSKAVVLVR